MKKIRILELTNFSAGGCGVWQRAKQESLELSRRGYEVRVFSSNATKGSNDIAPENDFLEGIKIKRFSFKKLGGESFMLWNFEKEALDFKPDVIIAHSYRHSHTGKALKLAEKIRKNGGKCKVFLVTHAPFIEGNKTRSLLASLIVNSYDFFLGHKLNKFDKVIAITRWEMPILLKLGLKKDKIAYIPNGLPQEFFSKPKKGKGILFLGRISPVKNLEVLLMAVKNLKIQLDLVGPAEREYQESSQN